MARGYYTEIRPSTKSSGGQKRYRTRVKYKKFDVSQSFKTKIAADAWGRKQVDAIDTGVFKLKEEIEKERQEELKEQQLREYTLSDALNNYIEILPTRTKREENRKKDYKWKKRVIDKYEISKLYLSEIDARTLSLFVDARRKDGVKDNTVRNDLNAISRIFTYEKSIGTITGENPVSSMDKIAKPKKSKPRERRLEKGEEEIILAELAKDKRGDRKDAIWLPYLFRFAINSGLKLGETSRIEPDEELINEGLVYLHETKNENDRKAPLTQAAKDALLDFKPWWGEKTIFTLDEKSLSAGWYRFKTRLLEQGMLKKNLTMHDLRHESLSRLFEINNSKGEGALSLADIISVSGHEEVTKLIKTYVKVDPRKTVEKLRAVNA